MKKVLCLPEHRTPWAMSPHIKLAQYSHQCGPRNVWTCDPKRRKMSENSVIWREVALDMKHIDDVKKQRLQWEWASLTGPFLSSEVELQTDRRKQRYALISENPLPIHHAPGQSQKGMWSNSKIIGPCHQLRNETLTTPNKALCGQTQDSLGWSP